MLEKIAARLRRGSTTVWFNPDPSRTAAARPEAQEAIDCAMERWERFAPLLARVAGTPDWDGRIHSDLMTFPGPPTFPGTVLVKADHALPLTGSVKARGGVYEVLCVAERVAAELNMLPVHGSYESLLAPRLRELFQTWTVVTASTGNLGFSVGLMARALGLQAEIHMSADAKAWKKERLRALGVNVVEHATDYTGTLAAARVGGAGQRRHFIDDEDSLDLFMGYTGGAVELAAQLAARDIQIDEQRPLFVYLPCGVGGAPGGISYALRNIFGPAVVCTFVEPVASACMLLALAGRDDPPASVYDYGLDNLTEADGLAVGRASRLVVDRVGPDVDACVAVPDEAIRDWARRAWTMAQLRLEVSAAAGFAAIEPLRRALAAGAADSARSVWRRYAQGVHVVWTTGGSMIPESEFTRLHQGGAEDA